MKKKSLLLAVAGIMLAAANAPTAEAYEVSGVGNSKLSSPPVSVSKALTDGRYNFRYFEVETSEGGEYYTEFWLLPARLSDKSYSAFNVYVNDSYVGDIKPSAGNWQASHVNGHEALNLSKGKNVITVVTPAPQVPEVESIKVAKNYSDAKFSSEAYENYLDKAKAGVTYDIPEAAGTAMYTTDSDDSGQEDLLDIPLNYTFYTVFSFTKGEEIFITSSSASAHKLDMVYYGHDKPIEVPIIGNTNNYGSSTEASVGLGVGEVVPDLPTIPRKPQQPAWFVPATSEEMQGLGFVYPSQKAENSSMQVASAIMTIPKTGKYLVRVRHLENGGTGVADVNVNGEYFYENVPITLSYRDCVIPADGSTYAVYTLSDNFSTDDPYLFIHGGRCDKIVGYNDDTPKAMRDRLCISTYDSYISQRYLMKTSGISVSNYSSYEPESSCCIFWGVASGTVQSASKMRAKRGDTTATSAPSIDTSIRIISPQNVNGILSVTANEDIQKISVYGLAGNCLGSFNCDESNVSLPASSLNMSQPGIYVISVETTAGVTSQKIIIKQ